MNTVAVCMKVTVSVYLLPQQRIDQYFNRIAEIIKKGKVPARIRFMLQDVQDLRANNWVQRSRQESSLKTIDQVTTGGG